MAIRLTPENLSNLSEAVQVPTYNARQLQAGILHFGVGNFHRAHQAVYLDDLFNAGDDRDWAIVGASMRPADEEIRQKLKTQDWLTTVVEQEMSGSAARVTASMVNYLEIGDTFSIIEHLAAPSTRIVSLTITEGGYFIDPATQHLDANHPDIVRDVQDRLANPQTTFGLILAGLKRRSEAGMLPFTIMSCDNIPGNGHVTQQVVVGLAELIDVEFAEWIRANVAFPNSMVDRITPLTSDRERKLLEEEFGISDNWPVFCESYRQWVLEDNFPAGRPALEKVGVQFVSDVVPFELMKIRILNGGGAIVGYPAALLDIHFVHEAMKHPLINAFFRKVEHDEIIPVVPPVPETNLNDYYELIDRRFSNPKIGDTITRFCHDGTNRQPKFILPTVADRLKAGASVDGLALVSAFWCRYCYGETDSGAPIASNDPNWDRLQAHARRARSSGEAWLEMTDIFGDLSRNDRYIAAFKAGLESVWSKGTYATLESYLSS
ncbi:mannitol dehydrogenase family protein [Shinella zoogloeoides]|jgi:mannitol 2-dehydrogenase|uniref:mannitol dehydrogenase family protein n=1 Tax=Shinella zoogloeoides TaxID=352475 RepID=UPI000E652AB2|nr:mannitol dehydrogenase family protein [Shinella zoogloeoides]